ncbi:unnamed protein product [Trifolium pratense]|uniref:Uncharacterized protein n=1 Tax=Trifolium pratense TaxID=57577 RepID=A0ACB0L924_TRIPR|nr:unnamed protein product [Trifolium pratense]
MVDLEIVCCMCGDVGFTDKLFRCNKCRHRFQHSYCSNFYGDQLSEIQECDWCQTEAAKSTTTVSSSNSKKPPAVTVTINSSNSGCSSSSGDKIMKRKSPVPSPRHATRRYKLLKDVMC